MGFSWKNFLITAGIGLASAVLASALFGAFRGESTREALFCFTDGFFLIAVLLLAAGGLTWTKNGGVFDGLGFTFHQAINRIRKQYEDQRKTFADYRQEREAKARSPWETILAGAVLLAVSVLLLIIYQSLS